jgi:hypothetical protein
MKHYQEGGETTGDAHVHLYEPRAVRWSYILKHLGVRSFLATRVLFRNRLSEQLR